MCAQAYKQFRGVKNAAGERVYTHLMTGNRVKRVCKQLPAGVRCGAVVVWRCGVARCLSLWRRAPQTVDFAAHRLLTVTADCRRRSDAAHLTQDGDTVFHPLCVALGNLPWELAKQKGWYTPIALLPIFPSTMPAAEKRARTARVLKVVLDILKVAGVSVSPAAALR